MRGGSSRRLSTDRQIININKQLVKPTPTSSVVRILGQYFNGIEYTIRLPILVDTETSHNYMNHTKK